MARILFVTWGGAGNQAPAIGLACALRDRGHAVVFAGYPEQQRRYAELGFPFRVLPRAQHAWPSVPPADWMPALVDAVWACAGHLDDVPDLVESEECDRLVIDCLMFGALAAAERLSVSTVALVHSAPGALAPAGGPFDALVLDPVNRLRATLGAPPLDTLGDAWRPFLTLCTSVRELDPVASVANFVGPIFEPDRGTDWTSPWPYDDPRPLVLASFSTGQAWDQTSRIQRTLTALDDGNHRVLVTTGEADLRRLSVPGDAALVPFVPHRRVLPHAAVTVTHAGHGTVAASLAHGVPLVALPNLAADQPALAARIAELGAGVALDGEHATPAEIADAVRRVIADPGYAVQARDLREIIAHHPLSRAVDAVEEAATGVRRTGR